MKKRPTMSNPELQGLQERRRHVDAIYNLAQDLLQKFARQSNAHPIVLGRAARRRARKALGLA